MALSDWLGLNNGNPEFYLNANYGVFGYDNIILCETYFMCYGVKREFSRSGYDITAEVRIKVGYSSDKNSYDYEKSAQTYLLELVKKELDVYHEGLEKYREKYNDNSNYRIKEIIFIDDEVEKRFFFDIS